MTRYFSTYKLEIKEEEFKTENDIIFPRTAFLTFLEKDGKKEKEIETIKLAYVEQKDIFDKIKNRKDIQIDHCFIQDFSLDEYRKINELKKDKLITMRNFSAENSFFASEKEITFRRANFIGKRAVFSHSIFYAPKLSFATANFEKADADFDYITFHTKDLDFSAAVFGDYNVEFKNGIFYDGPKNFENITFGKGEVNFLNAEFNKGDVTFQGARFGNGKTNFRMSRFGKGKINFARATFGTGDVTFEKVNFGAGGISFRSVDFGPGKTDFTRCEFLKGKKDFSNAMFRDGNCIFKGTNFHDGKISFKLADFGHGNVDFHFSKFGDGDLVFERTKFHDGILDFKGVEFGTGKISLHKIEFGNGDIIFEGAEMKSGSISFKLAVFGNGAFNFENTIFSGADLIIDDVNFGEGKVSFNRSEFNSITLKSSQINNYFDLRVKKCGKLDLSDTIIKDILDIRSFDFDIEIDQLDLTGVRLLGTIYIDWDALNVKRLIYQQESTLRNKSEQFRTLKENYHTIGMYQAEDDAYIEFKRSEALADLQEARTKPKLIVEEISKLQEELDKNSNRKQKLIEKDSEKNKEKIELIDKEIKRLNKNIQLKNKEKIPAIISKITGPLSYFFKWLIFDKMGLYATDPVRVLVSMLFVYLAFVVVFIFNGLVNIGDIIYSVDAQYALRSIVKTFYFSAVTFLTIGYGDYYPIGTNRILVAMEGFAGLFMMSYFTVAFDLQFGQMIWFVIVLRL